MISNLCYLYSEVFKNIEKQIAEIHDSDIKYNKTSCDSIDIHKFEKQLDVKKTKDYYNERLVIYENERYKNVRIDEELDVYNIVSVFLICIINKIKAKIVKKDKKDYFLFTLLLTISNSLAKQFGLGENFFITQDALKKGEKYDFKITKNRKKLILACKNGDSLNFNL